MKLCWDNLEKLEYRPDRGEWQDKKHSSNFYIYKENCRTYKDPYLTRKDRQGVYCNIFCKNHKENHPMYGKYHSEKAKKKISNSTKQNWKNNVYTDDRNKKIGKSLTGKNSTSWKGGYHSKNIPFYNTYAPQISYAEKVKCNQDDKNILEVKCTYCGRWFIPTLISVYNRIGTLNGNYRGDGRFYCSNQCKQECPIFAKKKFQVGHPKANYKEYAREVQAELRQLRFEIDNYTCQYCNKHQTELEVGLHCHHLECIRHNPLESADLDMVITACKTCHKKEHKKEGFTYYDCRCKGEKNESNNFIELRL